MRKTYRPTLWMSAFVSLVVLGAILATEKALASGPDSPALEVPASQQEAADPTQEGPAEFDRLIPLKVGAPNRQHAAATESVAVTAPVNDSCSGAVVIPDGPYPVLSAITTGVQSATGAGDPSNSCSPSPVENGVWYQWTPAVTAKYTISTCAGPTATTDGDGVLAVFKSASGCAGPFTQVAGACNDDGCHYLGPSNIFSLVFQAGTTYYILASHYPTGSGGGPDIVQYQIQIGAGTGSVANDTCLYASEIPPAGPFPYLSPLIPDVTGASTQDRPPSSCLIGGGVNLWYKFTPAVSGNYSILTCSLEGVTGTTSDGGVAIYTSGQGCVGPFTEIPSVGFDDGCDSGSCPGNLFTQLGGQGSFVGARLTAGTEYLIFINPHPSAGRTAVQVRVEGPPPNDTCTSALPVSLDIPVSGTSTTASNDYQTVDSSFCYSGVGQTPTQATGRDLVYTFTAPSADRYSFRVSGKKSGNAVIVGDCLEADPPVLVSCNAGANRVTTGQGGINGSAEEVACLPLRAAQRVWVYVDEESALKGGPYAVQVTRCYPETEPNGTPPSASAFTCGIQGSINPGGDADFYALGTQPAGNRVFAYADTAAANAGYLARLTDSVNTLQYSPSRSLAGTPANGGATFLRIDGGSASVVGEPYHLYAVVQPPLATATPETEPNDTFATANTSSSGYFSGSLHGPSPSTDGDVFRFDACQGDMIYLSLDENPLRDNTPIGAALVLESSAGLVLVATNVTESANSLPGTGLNALTPTSPGESIVFAARYSGAHYAFLLSSSGAVGDYLLSITKNCVPEAQNVADLSVSQTDAPDPVNPGSNITYSITVSNTGPVAAPEVTLSGATPPNTTFVSVSAPAVWSCNTPSTGATGTITCTTTSLGVGSALLTVVVKVDSGTPDGATITNNLNVASCRVDSNLSNNASSGGTTVTTSLSMPPADSDCFDSAVNAHVTLSDPFHPGGCSEALTFQGPFKVWWSNPYDPGDGRRVVQTVMACSRYSGSSSAGSCALGQVIAHTSTTTASLGEVRATAASADFPADATFDVFLTLETAAGRLHTSTPTHLTASVDMLPPDAGEVFQGPGTSVPLYDDGNVQVGTLEVMQEQIQSLIACPCECEPQLTMDANKQTIVIGIPWASPGVQYDVAKGDVNGVSPDWLSSLAAASCAASDAGPTVTDAATPASGHLYWYVSRDGAFGQANGTYNSCAGSQTGDRDLQIAPVCP